jgi:hypothetical protein
VTPVPAIAEGDIELSLTADGPIRSIEAPGVRSIELRGNKARLVVAKWTGSLAIDATLDGGKHARANVDAQGSHDVKLSPGAKAPPIKPTAHPTATATELQSNPYGNP